MNPWTPVSRYTMDCRGLAKGMRCGRSRSHLAELPQRGTLLSSGTEEQCSVHKDRQESACIGATSNGAIHGGQTWTNSRLNATRCGEAWWLPPPTAPLSHSPSCFLFSFRSSVAWISSSRRRNVWQTGRAEEAQNGASRIVYYPFSIH